MQLKFFVAAFASLALASAVALPEPQDASPPFVCGCTNACKLANKPGILCPEYCDPKYECPPTPVSYAPTTTQTPIRITETCGPCLNDCLVGCPDLRLCRCADFCDPKYFCPTSTTTTPTRPTLTPRPTFVCGCTNACKIACPTCICPQYCDPKYECDVAAALSIKTTKTTAAPPKPTCGCTNDCIVNCPPGENCICPQYCAKLLKPLLWTLNTLAQRLYSPRKASPPFLQPLVSHAAATMTARSLAIKEAVLAQLIAILNMRAMRK
ncbi:hypothetical protein TWF703_004797 [Orbilia oligospora]|uniref:Uncharacterized protein n=1 Tax=Orbilia oligospora TaxID=2813651 RepID=A0A7C8JE96_ORBOL|nr:hypothetical protein TWF703_004797 [Orbilia oligospora]